MAGENEGHEQDQDQQQVESEARRQGWRPQEEFHGKGDWVDADTFVRRGLEIKAYTKKENDRLRAELDAEKAARLEQGKTIEEIREYHKGLEKRAIEGAIAQLKTQRRAAVVNGDMELVAQLDEDIQELKDAPSAVPEVKQPVAPAAPVVPPQLKQWNEENAHWYNNDPENEDLVAYANGLAAKLGARKDLSIEDRLAEMDERVRKTFPDRFGGRKQASVTSGAGAGNGRSGSRQSAKSASSLPAEARQAGERFVKSGLYKTLDEYAAEYWNQPGARA